MPFFSHRCPAPPVPTSISEVVHFVYRPSPPTSPNYKKPLPPPPRTHNMSPRKLTTKPLPPIPMSPVSPISYHGSQPASPVSVVSQRSPTKLSVYPISHPPPARYVYPPTDPHRPSVAPRNAPISPDPHCPSATLVSFPASLDPQYRALLRQEICTLEKLRTRISRVLRGVGDVWALQCGEKVVQVHKRKLEEVVEEVKREAAEVWWEFEGLKKAGAVGEEVAWVCRLLREVEREVEVARQEIKELS